MKPGGLLWIEVPDFEGSARRILRCRNEEEKEIYYRHIFGSQVGPGEVHYSGFTAERLIWWLESYGFRVHVAYVRWWQRDATPPYFLYPVNRPLPDLTVKAVKSGLPRLEVVHADWTPMAYRRRYPNPLFWAADGRPPGGAHASGS
jgi:hypothetical protein